MKALFSGRYRPTTGEFKQLWDTCIFAFDASILLNLYEYKQKTRNDLLSQIKELEERIWLPYQAALEFHNSRIKVIYDIQRSFDNFLSSFNNQFSDLKRTLDDCHQHTSLDAEKYIKKAAALEKEISEYITTQKNLHPDSIRDDKILEEITKLFEGKVGYPLVEDVLRKIENEGKQRYAKKIPPGYKDATKENNEYGDLIIWKELIDKAKKEKKPIIFVTDDKKEDWWLKAPDAKTIGPRPELIEEFKKDSDQSFYMYTSDSFVRAKNNKFPESSIEDIKNVQEKFDLEKNRKKQQLNAIRRKEIENAISHILASSKNDNPLDYGIQNYFSNNDPFSSYSNYPIKKKSTLSEEDLKNIMTIFLTILDKDDSV